MQLAQVVEEFELRGGIAEAVSLIRDNIRGERPPLRGARNGIEERRRTEGDRDALSCRPHQDACSSVSCQPSSYGTIRVPGISRAQDRR